MSKYGKLNSGMSRELSDQLKGLAILMVVWIHIQAFFPIGWWQGHNWLALTLVTLDQIGRLSVPLFIFLSWYGLAKKYGDKPAPVSLIFRSAQKLLPLYLIWSGLMMGLMSVAPGWKYAIDLVWWHKLLLGQADYQLYFVPLIFMMYILFVIVSHLPKTVATAGLWVVGLLTLGWFAAIPHLTTWFDLSKVGLYPDQLFYLIPVTWLWYAWLGLITGRGQLWAKSSLGLKLVLLVGAVASSIWAIAQAWSAITSGGSILLATMFTRFPILLMVTFTLGVIVSNQAWFNRWHWPSLARLGVFSYVVYLIHTQVIRLTLSQIQAPQPLYQWLLGVGTVVIVLVVHFLTSRPASVKTASKSASKTTRR